MIAHSPVVAAVLSQPNPEAFYLVTIGSYRTTSHFSDVTLSDGSTFVSDGRLLTIDPPRISTSVDRELFKLALSDDDDGLTSLLESNPVGAPFEVRIGFINTSTGQPYTNINDTVVSYGGIVDSVGQSIQTGELGDKQLIVNGASPMADLDAVRTFTGSRDYIRGIAPDDSSFDQVYEGSGQVNLKWGKG